ncbi:MAG: hypothetical protein BGO68_02315 [Candidatus Amoebophilus sp. 36-38]|nr:MAG: hypothetical protein BGO68_02315 [Candidatus Amoebophilus sp. 36-38]
MLKYLFRPFVLFAKELWRLLAALLLVFRKPLLLLLSFFLASSVLAIPLSIFLYYHKFNKIDFNLSMEIFRYVEKYAIYCFLSLLLAFLFFYRILNRIVPDGRNILKADSMKLRRGMNLPLSKQTDTFVWRTSDRYKSIVVSSPYQGIYVEGSIGAGKSASVVERFIYQVARQGFSGFLYDFKGNPPTLSSTLYGAISKYKPGIHFYIAFIHTNTEHKHIHLYVNRISYMGKAYDDQFINNRAVHVAEGIAKDMGLQTAKEAQQIRYQERHVQHPELAYIKELAKDTLA